MNNQDKFEGVNILNKYFISFKHIYDITATTPATTTTTTATLTKTETRAPPTTIETTTIKETIATTTQKTFNLQQITLFTEEGP